MQSRGKLICYKSAASRQGRALLLSGAAGLERDRRCQGSGRQPPGAFEPGERTRAGIERDGDLSRQGFDSTTETWIRFQTAYDISRAKDTVITNASKNHHIPYCLRRFSRIWLRLLMSSMMLRPASPMPYWIVRKFLRSTSCKRLSTALCSLSRASLYLRSRSATAFGEL